MNQVATYDPETGELPATTAPAQSLVGQLVKAEIDQQIATAHAYPRSVSRVVKNVLSLVTISQASAEECNYALPRGGKPITGPSVRLAEIVASQWGNCRVGARVVHVDRFEKFVEAEGIFHDLETNTSTTARVRRRIVDRNGRLFNDDMIVVTGNAACSIAKRNAILGGVPKAVWNEAYDAALATIKGDIKTLPERRTNAFKAFAAFGVKPEQIVAYLDLGGVEDVTLEHLTTLIAMHKAIKDGEQTVESFFPEQKSSDGAKADGETQKKGTADKMADIAKGKADNTDKKPPKEKTADPEPSKEERQKAAEQRHADDRAEAHRQHEDDVAERVAETPQEGQQADPGTSGDTDSDEAREAAYGRGKRAFDRGMTQDGCPPDLRKDEAMAEAWVHGWNDARDEKEAGK